MPNLNVVVLGQPGFSSSLAKKSSVSDMAFYDLKKGQAQITIVEPVRYPERLAPLFYACSLADMAVIVVEKVDHLFGEAIVMLDTLGVSKGAILLKGFIQKEQVAPLLQGTLAEGYDFIEDDPVALRESLLDAAASIECKEEKHGSVPVDHHFNVKGVGTVVLGKVSDGTIRKHDKLTAHPLGVIVNLRSIQKHDDDFDTASAGDRVGLALRGIDSDRLDRGHVLSNDPRMTAVEEFDAVAEISRFWRTPLREGMVIHIGHWMQMVPCRVVSVSGEAASPELSLKADDSIIHLPGDKATIMYLEGGKLRVAGSLTLPR